MKSLTVAAIILMSMQLITGLYGMNFKRMPELSWAYGYPLAAGVMISLGLGLLYYFRKIKWL